MVLFNYSFFQEQGTIIILHFLGKPIIFLPTTRQIDSKKDRKKYKQQKKNRQIAGKIARNIDRYQERQIDFKKIRQIARKINIKQEGKMDSKKGRQIARKVDRQQERINIKQEGQMDSKKGRQ